MRILTPWLLVCLVIPTAAAQTVGASELLFNSDGRYDRYNGIGRYRGGYTCTAFWIDTGGVAAAPAYAMMAGHCVDQSATRVILDQALTGTVTFRFFQDTQAQQLAVPARRTAWSSMKAADVSIIELGTTYGNLRDAGLRPLAIAAAAPPDGEAIEVVGAPVNGVPADESFLRRAVCTAGASADLIEFVWHFWDARRNQCSDIYGGSSGSPVIVRATGQVFGVLNTTTAGAAHDTGDFPCYNGQPCEAGSGGVQYLRDMNYTIPVAGAARCFNSAGRFEVTLEGCPLDPGRQADLTTPIYTQRPPAAWNVTVSGAYAYYRYKTFAEGRDACRNAQGYGAPLRAADAPRITDALPTADGRYYLCVLAGNTAQPDTSWQQARFASQVHIRIDTSVPTIRIPYVFRDRGAAYTFDPIFVVPELSNYEYKIVSADSESCADRQGYQPYRRFEISIPKAQDPGRLCVIGSDNADNATPPLEIRLRGTAILPEGVRNAAWTTGPDPRSLAPGSLISIFGVNFGAQATVRLTDGSGVAFDLPVLFADSGQINAQLPAAAVPGDARIEVTGTGGTSSAAVRLVPGAPGIFTAGQTGADAPAGYAVRGTARQPLYQCAGASSCAPAPVDPPGQGEELALLFYVTGLARASRDEGAAGW